MAGARRGWRPSRSSPAKAGGERRPAAAWPLPAESSSEEVSAVGCDEVATTEAAAALELAAFAVVVVVVVVSVETVADGIAAAAAADGEGDDDADDADREGCFRNASNP